MNGLIRILARARDILDDLDPDDVQGNRARAQDALDSIIEYLTQRAAEGKPFWRAR
jgi:hypothetical protein